ARQRSAVREPSEFRAQKAPYLDDRLNAVLGNLETRWIVEHPPIFELSKNAARLGNLRFRRIALCAKGPEIEAGQATENLLESHAPLRRLRLLSRSAWHRAQRSCCRASSISASRARGDRALAPRIWASAPSEARSGYPAHGCRRIRYPRSDLRPVREAGA